MNKQLPIGWSIIAVVVLVLAGISPVVGFDSVRSSMKNSPLFSVRTKRAINEETQGFLYDYIGKGELIPFPTRDSKVALLQKAANLISSMNDREFNDFLTSLIHSMMRDDTIKDENVGDVIQAIYQLRVNPNGIKNNKDIISPHVEPDFQFTIDGVWEPGCFLGAFVDLLIIMFVLLLVWIFGLTSGSATVCLTTECC